MKREIKQNIGMVIFFGPLVLFVLFWAGALYYSFYKRGLLSNSLILTAIFAAVFGLWAYAVYWFSFRDKD